MRIFFFCGSLVILIFLPVARADSFEQFTASGEFLNFPNQSLTGGFVVDETTGQVAVVDLFHGTDQLNLLRSTGQFKEVNFVIVAATSTGKFLNLALYVPGNGGSLAGYGGGPICGSTLSSIRLCAGVGSDYVDPALFPDFSLAIDDLNFGSIVDSGPVPPPAVSEPGALVFLRIGIVILFLLLPRVRLPERWSTSIEMEVQNGLP